MHGKLHVNDWLYTENTLSEHGTVNRGCKVDEENNLVEVNERIKLAMKNGVVKYNMVMMNQKEKIPYPVFL